MAGELFGTYGFAGLTCGFGKLFRLRGATRFGSSVEAEIYDFGGDMICQY
jgi:hypothetical protein